MTQVMFGNGGCSKQEGIVCALTPQRTLSPAMSMQKQMAADGVTWGHLRQRRCFSKTGSDAAESPSLETECSSVKSDFQKTNEKRS